MERWKGLILAVLLSVAWDFKSNAAISASQASNLHHFQKHERWRRDAISKPTEFDLPGLNPKLPNITSEIVLSAILEANKLLSHRITVFHPSLQSAGIQHEVGSAAYFMGLSHQSNLVAQNISKISRLSEETTRILAQRFSLSREEIAYTMPNLDIRSTPLGRDCPVKMDIPCQPRTYRAYDGFCNNVQFPKWGSTNTRYLRYIMPDYADGVSIPRIASDGSGLPSPRSVSLGIHSDSDKPHGHLMVLTAIWAQFISHDISHTPQMTGSHGSQIKCCQVPVELFHTECYPIRIPESDPYYTNGERCQEYVRTSVAPRMGCTLGPREQINQQTSFLDGSQIYGTSKKKADSLRTFYGGLLRTQFNEREEELLPSEDNPALCRANLPNLKCFQSGDDRVNENVGLTAMHLLFFREHNRLARDLAGINPHWSDEELYQEARRFVGAKIQHITYSEFLPIILGDSAVDTHGLKPESSGFYHGYDINTNPGVLNGVATAALWFFISLMPKTMSLFSEAGKRMDEKNIQNTFFAPFDLYRIGGFEEILRGLVRGKAQSDDQFINDVMTNKMFEPQAGGFGMDIAAQLIQAGRDHGIPSYVYYRELCGFRRIEKFKDLHTIMSQDVILSLQSLYKTVEDIDLFTGGLSEQSVEGAAVGETFGCLLGLLFQRLRKGDRFWYENELPPSGFSAEQLQEIKKTTLARLICDNAGSILKIQPKAFLNANPFLNDPMECSGNSISRMDLSPWRTEQPKPMSHAIEIREAIRRAGVDLTNLHSMERNLWKASKGVDPHSPAGTAFGFSKPKSRALEIANTSFLLQFATNRFLNGVMQSHELQDLEASSHISTEMRELISSIPSMDLSALTELPQSKKCGEHDLPCDHTTVFRSISGWCNNLIDPNQGSTFRTFRRLLPPEYHDGLQIPRKETRNGELLPSARRVSTEIHDDISFPHQQYSLMIMQFGQLLDHDLTHTPMNKGFGNSILDCSSCDAKESVHPECWPIPVKEGDPHFPSINRTTGLPFCLAFTRSLPGQLHLGFREQLNQVTAYIDASHTYGSDTCEAKKLRTFQNGNLNTTRHPAGNRYKDLLPQTPTHPECKSPSGLCFMAGDLRTSEQPALTALHTVFTREHNRLASELQLINPEWDDETLYQHARRILSAVNQHITYAEWIPRVLGWDMAHKYKLDLEPGGYFEQYDSSCDATIFNEVGAAALRFGHSLLKPAFKRFTSALKLKEPNVLLRKTFFNTDLLYTPGMIDELLTGLVQTPMETLDNFITDEVTNHLFEKKRSPFSGMDLAALNIQRGRDHGLPGYNNYRELCNLTRAKTFQDLSGEISGKLISKFENLYPSVDDIDLFPGGLAERSTSGGLVGPTFACILGRQFSLLRRCDRFWYENSDSFTRFTPAQLSEIRKASLARLLCDNLDDISLIQRNVMDIPESFLNPRVPCNSIPKINLEPWRENSGCEMNGENIKFGLAKRISPCRMCRCTKEGPLCQSMKIENCVRLARTFSATEILSDPVCKVQCSFVFRLIPFSL